MVAGCILSGSTSFNILFADCQYDCLELRFINVEKVIDALGGDLITASNSLDESITTECPMTKRPRDFYYPRGWSTSLLRIDSSASSHRLTRHYLCACVTTTDYSTFEARA